MTFHIVVHAKESDRTAMASPISGILVARTIHNATIAMIRMSNFFMFQFSFRFVRLSYQVKGRPKMTYNCIFI